MKKLFLGLAFIGVLSFAFPAKAVPAIPEVQPCRWYTMTCSNGTSYYVIACSQADKDFWAAYYCGAQ